MMIQQILPPQKPLLLHIRSTSEKIFSGACRSFQDIPEAEFGAELQCGLWDDVGIVPYKSVSYRRGRCPRRSETLCPSEGR